jgi:hypothetical protein
LSATDEKREAINAFDFAKAFPEVFDESRPEGAGFDCVVGNPPYVKLQNFKKVYPETADFLRNAKGAGGSPLYQSCQTGNFDLFLPFIEHGIALLNQNGHLGFIAPSVWRFNEYGGALRSLIKKGRNLERWIDFGSFQVFDEATTYTALQFYSHQPNSSIQIALAPDGVLADIPDHDDPEWSLDYKSLPDNEPWVFASQTVLGLMTKLRKSCVRLDDPSVTESISQGLISGAFEVFALQRNSKDSYTSHADDPPVILKIEDGIMRRLISAQGIDPFRIDEPTVHILFPYNLSSGKPVLIDQKTLKANYPGAWAYLRKHEETLRKRDVGQFSKDGDQKDSWYAYSRNQNLDKQSRPKIVIAGTATRIEAALDAAGSYAANDKRVYSVFPTSADDLKFLCGILNSRLCTFFFKQIARPKDNGYFDIETQFLAPLPVPSATVNQKAAIAAQVDKISEVHRLYAKCIEEIRHRLSACSVTEMAESWLWPGKVKTIDEIVALAPSNLKGLARKAWAKENRNRQISCELDSLRDRIRPEAVLTASLSNGELRVCDGQIVVLDKVFVSETDAPLILASWRQWLRTHPTLEPLLISDALRKVSYTDNQAITCQVKELDSEAVDLSRRICALQSELDVLVFGLVKLDAKEKSLIERYS